MQRVCIQFSLQDCSSNLCTRSTQPALSVPDSLSTYLPAYLYTNRSMHLCYTVFYWAICLSACLPACLTVDLSISLYVSISLSIYRSIGLSNCRTIIVYTYSVFTSG